MSPWRQLTRGLRALTNRAAADDEITDEITDYLERARAAHVARGLSPDQALRAARLELGGETTVRDQVRRYGWENVVGTTIADLRYATRRLRAAPGFTTVVVLTLALGLGAMTAIFSAVNPILFEPLPYPNANRIMAIVEMNKDGSRNAGTFGMFRGLADRTHSFDALAVFKQWQPTMTGRNQAARLDGQRISAGYFRVLGVTPLLGRDFQTFDDRSSGPNVVVLSYALWRRLGGDRGVVGRSITLEGTPYTIIGVMPQGFDNVLLPSAELWAPLQYDMSEGRAWGHHLGTIGRLRPGVTPDGATHEIDAIGRVVLREQHPETYGPQVNLVATSLQREVARGVRPALLAILGAVVLVLVIACVNVTNLLLARGVQRRGEFALRSALGATRRRLARQLLTESMLLAMLGGILGLIVAAIGVRALVALSPPGLPRVHAIGVHGIVFVFGFVVTTLIGLAVGVIPALQATRTDPQLDLQHDSRRLAAGRKRVRNALVIVEVALALVLLVSSGLLLRSVTRLFDVSPGFSAPRVLTMQVQLSSSRYDSSGATNRFLDDALRAVRSVPGVETAGLTSQLPLSGDDDEYGVQVERPKDAKSSESTFRYAITPGYFETMRIPLERGRFFDKDDRDGAPRVAVISESLARREFAGGDPIGQRISVGPRDPLYSIVGVVGDVKQLSLAVSQQAGQVYVATSQWPQTGPDHALSLVARTTGDPSALTTAVKSAIWSADSNAPIVRVATMTDLLAASESQRRFVLVLFETFALAALALSAVGIYGVLSGSVAECTHEIGVRLALGATRENILVLVLGPGLKLTGVGIAIGLAGAAISTKVIAAMLFGVSRLDAVTYLGVIALLGVVATIACGVPAWRAARLDPVDALRVS